MRAHISWKSILLIKKIYQAKLKEKLFLQNLPCINSLSFRKCLKHLYLFTDKILLACNKTNAHISSTYHCLSKLVLLLSKTGFFFFKRCKNNKDNLCDFTHFAPWCSISQILCHCSFAEGYFINVNKINTSKKYLD